MRTVHRLGRHIAQRGIGNLRRPDFVLLPKRADFPRRSPGGIHKCKEFSLGRPRSFRGRSPRRCRGNYQRILVGFHRRLDTDANSSVHIRRSTWRRFSCLLISVGFAAFLVPPGPSIAKRRNRVCNSCVFYVRVNDIGAVMDLFSDRPHSAGSIAVERTLSLSNQGGAASAADDRTVVCTVATGTRAPCATPALTSEAHVAEQLPTAIAGLHQENPARV
jgi:hypothetical protein